MGKKYLFSVLVTGSLLMASPNLAQAQLLKNILNTVKNTATQNVNNKAANSTNKTIDKIEDAGKTKSNTNANTNTPTPPAATSTVNPTSQSATSAQPSDNKANYNSTNEDTSKSYIRIKLSSDKILAGGTVIISGSSVMYQSLNKIALTISGSSASESKSVALKSDGSFSTTWQAGHADGYTITAKSSDGKSQATVILNVYEFTEMDSITGRNKEQTEKAYDNLVKQISILKPQLAQSDADGLQKKLDDVKDKKDLTLKLFADLDAMGKGLDGIEKKYGPLPSDISTDLSQVSDQLSGQAQQMEDANAMANHQATGNTICEYLVMANEACAAFSTITNLWAKTLGGVLKNIAIDKGVPASVGAINDGTKVGSDAANIHKECDKVATSAIEDAESLTSKLSIAGFAGDLAQMLIDHFLKKYCVVMSGTLSEDYQCTFRNDNKAIWWQYSYTTEATISMRYPKNNQGGNIIKMKGNIEGNATRFTIYQKASEIDEFKDAMKNRAALYSLQLHAPAAIPFSTSQNDKLGFGAVARAIVTPAYFNIPFDADYDVEAKKIKIYLNSPIMDFIPSLVSYIYAYLTFPLGIPLVTRVNFPINNVKLTLGKVIEKNNDFDIKSDANNNLFFSKKGDFKIGDESSAIEHNIDFTLSAKSE